MINIILCGGNGTRLWPLSRTLMPKQFVKLFGESSLFQLTVKRNAPLCKKQFVVSNAQQYFLALDQLQELQKEQQQFLLEPVGRNTAPAIALACFALDENELLLISPSDHLIKDEKTYQKVVQNAQKLAKEGNLVTFGITPTYAETGYGYIQAKGEEVEAFYEKPDAPTAQKYLEDGNFYWNSGMFCFEAGVFLQELQKYAPAIYKNAKTAYENAKKGEIIRIAHDDMQNIPEDSIDYAVMEKSTKVKVLALDAQWSDLGSFDSLDEEFDKDTQGNTKTKNLYTINANNNFVYTDERAVVLVGMQDTIVVDTSDALLISKKGASAELKLAVKQLKEKGLDLHYTHKTVHRPWGTYTLLEEADNYKIKRIVVKPKGRLSLQKHFHRSEHWVVVSGTAIVRVGESEKIIKTNESIYIAMGELHRLENPGIIDLVLIEAQVGSYLGEDDIVRVQDDYDRV